MSNQTNNNNKNMELVGYEQLVYDETTKIISMPEDDFQPHPQGMGHLMFHSMKKHADKVAQIDVETGEKDLYSDFSQRCIRTAIELKRRGIKPKDIISVCAKNSLNSCIPYVSASFIGAVLAGMDPSQNFEDMKFMMKDVRPKLIFIEEQCEETIKKVIADVGLDIPIVVFGKNFEEFISPKEGEEDFEPYVAENLEEDAIILFSSGTSGMPKGIRLSHNYILYHSKNVIFPVTLGYASLYWISITISLIGVINHGNIRLVVRDFDPLKLWEYIEKYQVFYLFLTPYQVIKVLEQKPKDLISSLKLLVIGGGFLPLKFLNKIRSEMPQTLIYYCYGQSELALFLDPTKDIIKERPESIGVPANGMCYKIVDPETEQVLGMHEKGELRVKSKWCMNGYLNRDSSGAWDEEGFLKTGDVAYFDDKFCFYIVDRIKEMFKFRGGHYVPAKVEDVLTKHPEIKLAAVIGIPNFEDEHHPMAVVVPVEGSKITEAEVEEYVNGKVDEVHKIRAGVKILDALPLTSNSKIDRRKLKAMFVPQN